MSRSLKSKILSLLSVFFLLISIKVYSQNKELDVVAKQMFIDMNNRDFDAIVNMTYPKVFDFASKEQMKNLIKTVFEGNKEMSINIPKIIPVYKLSKIFKKEKNNLEYAFVSYDLKMKMTFHNIEFDDEKKKMMIPMMKAKGMFVKFISNNSMDVLMKDRITIILRDDSTKNKWTMMNYDPDSPLFYQMTPTPLIEAAKKYKQDLLLVSKKNSEK
ncbi:hypothetical protein [Polaribacter aquimarinus]|uniref:Uncharacterized protein n=1 Tax=Polaribacter aquimarinus TaxID=2100726 RepID=A0A2U2JAC0_9FLAO|nr:hypothetical protein [Polaribacter aquimarinus]PWG05277.1 hypothetical protein DIS07_08550 [Polaribacter aquimarinus]